MVKRGNFSVIALGIFFLLFMAFVLFYKPNITSSITGYFVFDPKEVVVTNVSIPLSGNFSFTIEDKEGDTKGVLNITNNSFVRVLILMPDGRIQTPNDVWKTFEEISKKTTPELVFNPLTSTDFYKIPNAGIYKISISEFGITPSNNGTYKLIIDMWYNPDKLWKDFRNESAILVNLSSSYVPPSDNVKINKAYILGAELDKDGNIVKTRNNFVIGDYLLCYVNFTNKTAINMAFKYYDKAVQGTTLSTTTAYQCNSSNLCFGKYFIESFGGSEIGCTAELNNSLGNFVAAASSYIKILNRPPVLIDDIPDIEIAVGEDYVLDLSDYFSDPENDGLVYDALGTLHAFMNITDGEVVISGAQAYDGADVLIFRAIDSNGAFAMSNNVTVFYNGTASGFGCETDWSCMEFSSCVDGFRTRICIDKNECDVLTGKPVEKQKCTSVGDAEETSQAENNGKTTSPLTKLKEEKKSNVGLIILIIFIILALAGGGGAVYYFKFYKKTGEESEEKKSNKEEKKEEEVVGGVTGESSLYKTAENKSVGQTITGDTESKPAEIQPASNVDEIYKYFEQAADLSKAKEELLTAGWDKKDVQRAFDVTTLKRYVTDKIKAGFEKDKLKESLKSKGWKQDIIDDVFQFFVKN